MDIHIAPHSPKYVYYYMIFVGAAQIDSLKFVRQKKRMRLAC